LLKYTTLKNIGIFGGERKKAVCGAGRKKVTGDVKKATPEKNWSVPQYE